MERNVQCAECWPPNLSSSNILFPLFFYIQHYLPCLFTFFSNSLICLINFCQTVYISIRFRSFISRLDTFRFSPEIVTIFDHKVTRSVNFYRCFFFVGCPKNDNLYSVWEPGISIHFGTLYNINMRSFSLIIHLTSKFHVLFYSFRKL